MAIRLHHRPELLEEVLRAVLDAELGHHHSCVTAMLGTVKGNLYDRLPALIKPFRAVSPLRRYLLVELLLAERRRPGLPLLILLLPGVGQTFRTGEIIRPRYPWSGLPVAQSRQPNRLAAEDVRENREDRAKPNAFDGSAQKLLVRRQQALSHTLVRPGVESEHCLNSCRIHCNLFLLESGTVPYSETYACSRSNVCWTGPGHP